MKLTVWPWKKARSSIEEKTGHRYKAFISYSHRGDLNLAARVQTALHKFGKPWFRVRALRTFRDATNLTVSPSLWNEILAALSQSEFFILMASPEAAASPWVGKELSYWFEERDSSRILIILTAGELNWGLSDFDWSTTTALHPVAKGRFSDEPLWIDLRWARSEDKFSLRFPAFVDAIATIAARLHGRPKDDMFGEDIRQHRRAVQTAWSAAITLTALVAVAGVVSYFLYTQSRISRSRELAVVALSQLSVDPERSILLAREAVGQFTTDQAVEALRTSLIESRVRQVIAPKGGAIAQHAWSPRTNLFAASNTRGDVTVWQVGEDRHSMLFSTKIEGVQVLEYSRDGTALLVAATNKVLLIDSRTGKQMGVLEHKDRRLVDAALSSDSSGVFQCDAGGVVEFWSWSKSKRLRTMPTHNSAVTNFKLSKDGLTLAVAHKDGKIALLDARSGKLLRYLRGFTGHISDMSFSPNDKLFAAGSWSDRFGTVWHSQTGKEATALTGHRLETNGIAFSPDGQEIVTSSMDGTARMFSTSTGRELAIYRGHAGGVSCVQVSPDGHYVVTGGLDGAVFLWDADTGSRLAVFRGPSSPVRSVSFLGSSEYVLSINEAGAARIWACSSCDLQKVSRPDGETSGNYVAIDSVFGTVATLGRAVDAEGITYERDIRLWDSRTGKLMRVLVPSRGRIRRCGFSPDGQLIAGIGDDGLVEVWPARGGGRSRVFEGHYWKSGYLYAVRDLAFSRDSRWLATTADDSNTIIWNVATGQVAHKLAGHGDEGPVCVTFSLDGELVVTGGYDNTAIVWRRSDGKLLRRLSGHKESIDHVLFDQSGTQIVTIGYDSEIKVWRVGDGVCIATLRGHSDVINSAVLGTGNRLLTASVDGAAMLWDLNKRTRLGILRGHTGQLYKAGFSHDGRWIVTASGYTTTVDNTAKIWNAETGQVVLELFGHQSLVVAAVFSQDDRSVITTTMSGRVHFYDFPYGGDLADLERLARKRTTRALTGQERFEFLHER